MNLTDGRWSPVLILGLAALVACFPDSSKVEDPLLKVLNGPRITRTDDTGVDLIPPQAGANDDYKFYQSPLLHQNSESRKKRAPTYCHKCGYGGYGGGGGGWGGGGWGGGGGGCGHGGCGGGGPPTKIIVVPVTVQKGWGGGGHGGGGGCRGGCCGGNCGGGGGGSGGYGGGYSQSYASASASSYSSGGGYGGGWGKK